MTTETTAMTGRATTRLAVLISEVREAVALGLPPDPTAYLVGERIAPRLGADDLLTAEHERRYRLVPSCGGTAARLVATEDVVNPRGTVCGLAPPGDIHQIWNAGTDVAISLHVYGADLSRLGTSVRRVYAMSPGL
ncbi:hypothetical protein [Streptomyces sp. Wb2n-11]|uniref:hypothetical protein n=1 Tax=Streptomyces sp. Wb2n-11 TaxID=1030533 RepID=UPI000A9215E1|nr:hypothetical protein [Streptomyces sp. Wb2n-11]